MWKYCGRISQLGFFILYIIFYSFISFSSKHVSPISLLLFLFLLQNLPATSFALLIKEKRERKTKREEKDWGIGVHHAVGDRGSPCTTTSAVPPRLILLPTIRLGQINLFFFFSFFFFSYLLVLIQLYFIRIGICFVFCVWIMWETRLDRLVLFLFSFFFFFFFHICLFWFNFILIIGFCIVFCVWINYFAHEQVSLFSLFLLFFWFHLVYEKKISNGNGENERMRGKKKAMERIREKKKSGGERRNW